MNSIGPGTCCCSHAALGPHGGDDGRPEAALHVEDMAGYPGQLAVGLMAALRGGCLLANTAHDVRPMEIAPDLALGHVKSCLTEP